MLTLTVYSHDCHDKCELGFTSVRTLVDSVKTIVESQRHVGPIVAFTGYPPKTQQPYKHVAQGQTVFPGPIGM